MITTPKQMAPEMWMKQPNAREKCTKTPICNIIVPISHQQRLVLLAKLQNNPL